MTAGTVTLTRQGRPYTAKEAARRLLYGRLRLKALGLPGFKCRLSAEDIGILSKYVAGVDAARALLRDALVPTSGGEAARTLQAVQAALRVLEQLP